MKLHPLTHSDGVLRRSVFRFSRLMLNMALSCRERVRVMGMVEGRVANGDVGTRRACENEGYDRRDELGQVKG